MDKNYPCQSLGPNPCPIHYPKPRELEEKKEKELKEEKERLLECFRKDFEAYQQRSTELQDHLKILLEERNNLAQDFMVFIFNE